MTAEDLRAAESGEGQPRISVVMPVRDGQRHLAEQLEALSTQADEVGWELIVADNGSQDATHGIVRAAAETFPAAVRLVDASSHRGAAFARNAGAKAARGALLAFCDADDRVAPGWLTAAIAGLEHADVVGGPLLDLTTPFTEDAPQVRSTVASSALGTVVTSTCNLAIRRDAFMDLGGFDTSMPRYGGEDSEFAVRVLRAGLWVAEVDALRVYFRRTVERGSALRKVYMTGHAEASLWKKHPDQFPVENTWSWYPKILAEYPPAVVRELRRGNRRGLARYSLRRLGNIAGRAATRRGVPEAQLIDSVPMPRDITRIR